MKALNYKSLIVAASILIVSGLTAESALAQRGGRGGGMSRGGGISRGSISRGGGGFGGGRSAAITRQSYGRTVYGRGSFGRSYYGRPGYHSSFGFRRPYYGYRSFYRPYLGFSLSVLPYGYYPFYYGADQFYYSGGLFYRQYDNQYKVVVPPIGAEVPSLPEDAREVVINGQTYYEFKGVYYSESQNADGKTVYIVAGKDGVLNTDNNGENIPQPGDVVSVLPEGSREVVLKGQKYYVSPNDVYYEEVEDGNTVSYRVVSQ